LNRRRLGLFRAAGWTWRFAQSARSAARICWDLRVVARDGIEPPTPAFSGPRSTTELSGLRENFMVQFCARDSGVAGEGVQVPRNTALKTTSDSIATPIPGAKPGGIVQRLMVPERSLVMAPSTASLRDADLLPLANPAFRPLERTPYWAIVVGSHRERAARGSREF
jgi:hypothetical protein